MTPDPKLSLAGGLDRQALARQILRGLSPQDFLQFGLHQIAYIRPVRIMDRAAYALHAADGSTLSVIENFDDAVMTARQSDLQPVTLH